MATRNMLSYTFSILISLQMQKCYTSVAEVPQFPMPDRFNTFESVVALVNTLSEYNPIDLGLGFPDYTPSKEVQTALANAATSNDYRLSQYTQSKGLGRLLNVTSKFYAKIFNQNLDPANNIIVTAGATEALYLTFLTHTFEGDEWILFEPFYEPYLPMIKGANGVLRTLKLKPKVNRACNLTVADLTFDRKELASLFNRKTKGIVVNNPHNPTGKVFKLDELKFIADLAKKWKTLVVTDEAHQFSVFDNNKIIRIASFPGMFDQTITIDSAGKLFGVTGYRVGWAYGPKQLIDHLKKVHHMTVFNAPSPVQEAIAVALEQEIANYGNPDTAMETLKRNTQVVRDYLYRLLQKIGMTPLLPEGGFFIIANWTTMDQRRVDLTKETDKCGDQKFAKWFVKNVNIFGFPMSTFYHDVNECSGDGTIRFNLLKKYAIYQDAEKYIDKWLSQK